MSTINTTNLKHPSSATNNIVLNADGSVTTQRDLTLLTAKAWNWNGLSTNTSIDFTDIPSWAKRVTVILSGISTSGASIVLLRLGSTSFAVTGYNATGTTWASSSVAGLADTTGFPIGATNAASVVVHGSVRLENISGHVWVASGSLIRTDSVSGLSTGGTVTLSGSLDRVRLTTINGTDTFDAGSINILYE
jgi:hypothetical protein